ncbi:hypothetical protein [Pedobacter sp. SL55]|uniref:hypothetical protein n=1 Tax=Pedobacter sp. SL55 TaxID=2995161 RepID=UPI00226E3FDC|nr:hypothetical protein [Pedobacter sp. SL55]WAC42438.1 hypothetical protein OVA16_08815 [Pedobacter sp. SL55]
MSRFCLDCHTEIKGRADKKFCDDQCRNNYNNKRKSEDGETIRKINQILNKNRKLLKEESNNGNNKVKKESLAKKGFDFDYHTHYYLAETGNVYVFCYEYGYMFSQNDEVILLKRE